jgi:RsiG-like
LDTNTPNLTGMQMEPLPDLASLSDEDLKALIEKLEEEENKVSYYRRLLQGRVDILRAERTARIKGGGLGDVDHDRLTDILASRSTPEDSAKDEDKA